MNIQQRLSKAGFSADEIDEMVDDIQKGGHTPDDAEEGIDADALTEALSGIKETMEKSFSSDDGAVTEREEFYKSQIQEAMGVVEAVSAGADAIVVELQAQLASRDEAQAILWEQNQAMAKGILAIGETLEDLRGNNANLHKSMDAMTEAIDAPLEPKAAYNVDYVPLPGERQGQGQVPDRSMLISKALKEIQGADPTRQHALHKAVVALESGSPVSEIANTYLLN